LINLNEDEYSSGKYLTHLAEFGFFNDFAQAEMCGANIIAHKADNSCCYLENQKCSIHNFRPQACRGFFCSSSEKIYQGMISQIKKQKETKIF